MNTTTFKHFALILIIALATQLVKAQTGTTSDSYTINSSYSGSSATLRLNYGASFFGPQGIGTLSSNAFGVFIGSDSNRYVHQFLWDGLAVLPKLQVGTSGFSPLQSVVVAHFDGRVYVSENDSRYSGDNDTEAGFDNINTDGYKDHLLWVEKGIVSYDYVIADPADWPDYVFEDNYKLTPLKEVDTHIQQWGHLPTMPSAEEVKDKGYSVDDITKRMVQTIEELTLHTIEQQKQIEDLTSKLMELEAKLGSEE